MSSIHNVSLGQFHPLLQVKHWVCEQLAWLLRVKRPGKARNQQRKKSFVKTNKMRDLEMRERSSKSLLANVLDLDDDFRSGGATANSTSNHNNFTSVRMENDYRSSNDYHRSSMGNSAPPSYGLVAGDPTETDGSSVLKDILKEVRFLAAKKKKDDEFEDQCNDWKFAAMVIDRLCLWMFTIFTIVSTFAILFSAPHILS